MRGLINIIVLMAIFVLLGGLLLVSSHKVRAAAASAMCQNNLKQISLALHNYANTNTYFPTATTRNPLIPRDKEMSWCVDVYPFVEGSSTYGQMFKDKSWDSDENRFAAVMYKEVYHCPLYDNVVPNSTLSPTTYIGITGLGEDSVNLPLYDPREGFFGYDRKITFEIINGMGSSSALIALMETTQTSDSWITAGTATARGLVMDDAPVIGIDRPFGEWNREGAHFALADCSVRFIRASINPGLLKQMVTISGSGRAGLIED
jgi:hypothetical protein